MKRNNSVNNPRKPMWERSENSYSPLREMKNKGLLYINNRQYVEPNNEDFPDSEQQEQKRLYKDINKNLYKGNIVEKQMLETQLNHLVRNKHNHLLTGQIDSPKINFINQKNIDTSGEGTTEGMYVKPFSHLSTKGNLTSLISRLNHENTHNIDDLKKSFDYKSAIMKDLMPNGRKEYIDPNNNRHLNTARAQLKIDPSRSFMGAYHSRSLGDPNINFISPPNGNVWHPSEIYAHLNQNLSNGDFVRGRVFQRDRAKDNMKANNFLISRIDEEEQNMRENGGYKYPDLMKAYKKQRENLRNAYSVDRIVPPSNHFTNSTSNTINAYNNPLLNYDSYKYSDNDSIDSANYDADVSADYARGGYIDDIPESRSLADYIADQGRYGDSELAHINPEESELLKMIGGSGDINPNTGLREYAGGGMDRYYDRMLDDLKRKREKEDAPFLSKLGSNVGNFMADPTNLLSMGSAVASMLSRPKKKREKTGREIGAEELERYLASEVPIEHEVEREKRGRDLRRMSPDEMRDHFNYNSAIERANWEARNNLEPGERMHFDPVFRKENDEEERKKSGRWFEYYNDPEFKGKQVYYAKGGHVEEEDEEEEHKPRKGGIGIIEIMMGVSPRDKDHDKDEQSGGSLLDIINGKGHKAEREEGGRSLLDFINMGDREQDEDDFMSGFVDGEESGQSDRIPARVSPGEYIMDAETVSALGDGNSRAGAAKLDELRKKIRDYKRNTSRDEIAPKMIGF